HVPRSGGLKRPRRRQAAPRATARPCGCTHRPPAAWKGLRNSPASLPLSGSVPPAPRRYAHRRGIALNNPPAPPPPPRPPPPPPPAPSPPPPRAAARTTSRRSHARNGLLAALQEALAADPLAPLTR